ncbi:ferrous iron transport protein B [Eubacteriaceae bacterium ES3]|nr:ferrous iron transport protein B [Eubacteriaceae bacterium ES3]
MNYNVALVGNPNSGKTTLFNCLTGSNLYVGNWPGVTVEKKEGRIRNSKEVINLVDLPGIYSLAPYSMDEIVTRNYILEEKPDLIINIIDASNIERNLYLTTQLMELGCPILSALNMMDVVEKKGIELEISQLEAAFGIPFVKISAQKETGIQALITNMESMLKQGGKSHYPSVFPEEIKKSLEVFDQALKDQFPQILPDTPPVFRAVKLAEKDEELLTHFSENQDLIELIDKVREEITAYSGQDVDSTIADYRYRFITDKVKGASHSTRDNQISFQDRLDKVLMNRFAALPIFFLIMFIIYYVSITLVGEVTIGLIETFINDVVVVLVNNLLLAVGAADWLNSLINDGIVAGVGAVLTFIPQLFVLFIFIALLEDSGYMSRVAFMMDRVFRRFGLSGKSFIPLVVGLGCSVPGIMASRTLENERERKLTAVVTPFVSCGAKMPVYVLMGSVFFTTYQSIMVFGLYLVSLLTVFLSAFILSKTWFRGARSSYLLELPPYRIPKLKNTMSQVWERIKEFFVRAGTIIFAASVVLWFLQSFTPGLTMVSAADESILAGLGKLIAPIFTPLGFGNWVASVSLLSGMAAKEMIISTMSVLLSGAEGSFTLSIGSLFTQASAFSFMIFVLLASPCMAAIATMKKELGNWRDFLFALAYQMGMAYLVALLAYQVLSRLLV